MIDETYESKRFNRFNLVSLIMAIVFVISIAIPQQVTFADDHVDWQLKMIGADQAHEDGHKGEGIKIGVVDDKFEKGDHGDVVSQVVKHVAPNATVSQHSAYKEQSLTKENVKFDKGTFEVALPYKVSEDASFEMVLIKEDSENITTQIEVTVGEEDLIVTSSSTDFTDLKIIGESDKLQAKYKDTNETYNLTFNYSAMTSDSLATAIQAAIDEDVAIINISLGTAEEDSKIKGKIDEAVGKGIIVVASSGNHGMHADKTFIYYPAKHNDVISVGAVDEKGDYLESSNYGQVKAPGKFIYDNKIHFGTSIAAPYVAGLTALYMNLTNAEKGLDVKNLITSNVDDKGIVQYVPKKPVESEVDKTGLQDAIDRANDIGELNQYTKESYERVIAAVHDASTVIDNENATQQEVDQAQTTLESALLMLEKREEPDDGTGDGDGQKPGKDEKPSDGKETGKTGSKKKDGTNVIVEVPITASKAAPAPVVVEVGKTTPTPVQAEQAVRIGNTGSSIVMPVDLPTGVTITVKKVENTDDIVKDARTANLQIAGDIYTIELDNLDYNELDGTFTLTLNYDKDAEGTPAIYYYNEDTKEWERRGGRINAEEGTISIEVEHFSTYGVFVNPKALPTTATDMYTYIMFGLILIGLGFIVKLSGRRKAFVK